ncbi:MAG: peroxide stress protein YaaA [Salinivirgaceae bacterium]|nr:MAG: peroxide stress protein YaaA [Salinivirgaceae bacterium]
MQIILSPAKTLNFTDKSVVDTHATPLFSAEAKEVMSDLRQFGQAELGKLMGISSKLAELNTIRHNAWEQNHDLENSKQCVYAFNGEAYNGLNVSQFNREDMQFAQDHLKILSGLYGVLRPLDIIQPYRLEMGTKIKIGKAKNLYEFWGEKLAQVINNDAEKSGSYTLINLASNEYFKAVNVKALSVDVITPVFKELKNGQYKVISVYAKKARGLMTAYAIRNRITNPEELKKFNEEAYMFDANQSSKNQWVFTRG